MKKEIEEINSFLETLTIHNKGLDCFHDSVAQGNIERLFIKAIAQSKKEAVEEVIKKLRCPECDGSGAYSSPSDYGPCTTCDGTGFNINYGCLNDFVSEEDK